MYNQVSSTYIDPRSEDPWTLVLDLVRFACRLTGSVEHNALQIRAAEGRSLQSVLADLAQIRDSLLCVARSDTPDLGCRWMECFHEPLSNYAQWLHRCCTSDPVLPSAWRRFPVQELPCNGFGHQADPEVSGADSTCDDDDGIARQGPAFVPPSHGTSGLTIITCIDHILWSSCQMRQVFDLICLVDCCIGALLRHAARSNDAALIQLLLATGARVDAVDVVRPETALVQAVRANFTPVVGVLLHHGANPDLASSTGEPPLCIALMGNREETARSLLAHGADIDVQDSRGNAPLHYAVQTAPTPLLELILKRSPRINAVNHGLETPLLRALERGHLDQIDTLLEHGADVTSRDDRGSTVLHCAARSHNPEVLSRMCQHGLFVDVRDNDGLTPLHIAAEYGDLCTIRLLLEKGADVRATDNAQRTALHIFLDGESPDSHLYSRELVELLCESGVCVNAVDQDSRTALQVALEESRRMWFALTARVQGPRGSAALSTPRREEYLEALKIATELVAAINVLIAHGADPQR